MHERYAHMPHGLLDGDQMTLCIHSVLVKMSAGEA